MYELTIVGAGPAGLSAAKVADEHGLSVLVVDEQQRPGGQIFRQAPSEFRGEIFRYASGYSWGRNLVALPDTHPDIDWAFGSTAIGLLHDRDDVEDPSHTGGERNHLALAVHSTSGTRVIPTRRLLIATGAYDLPVPFPGWTLPGVIMAGGSQSLLKSQKLLLPGPYVLAGGHPFLFLVADQLLRAGAEITEVAYARGLPSVREAISARRALPGHVGAVAELAGALARLAKHRVRVSPRTVVTAARGDHHVEHVELDRTDLHGGLQQRQHKVNAATLVLGYGFLPSTELARQARCAMTWAPRLGGWVVSHDEQMQSSVPGVYVAGEPTGVAGAEQSRAEGTIAGQAVVEALRNPVQVSKNARARATKALHRATAFSTSVQQLFEPDRKALAALATPETIVCRCESVRQVSIDRALRENVEMSTANAIKLECRAGMGLCQGRYCESTVATLVAEARDRPAEQVGYFTAHLPIKPVPLSALAELDDD